MPNRISKLSLCPSSPRHPTPSTHRATTEFLNFIVTPCAAPEAPSGKLKSPAGQDPMRPPATLAQDPRRKRRQFRTCAWRRRGRAATPSGKCSFISGRLGVVTLARPLGLLGVVVKDCFDRDAKRERGRLPSLLTEAEGRGQRRDGYAPAWGGDWRRSQRSQTGSPSLASWGGGTGCGEVSGEIASSPGTLAGKWGNQLNPRFNGNRLKLLISHCARDLEI